MAVESPSRMGICAAEQRGESGKWLGQK